MDIRSILQVANLVLAVLAIPPSVYLVRVLLKEAKIVEPKQGLLNKVLVALFIGFSVLAVANSLVSFLSLIDFGRVAHNLSPFRATIINGFFVLIAHALVRVHKQTNGN